uniref:Uncharacterized protein n=1 Tax=Haptolina brevifila TaxID=156173 RepID=A0A7S2N6M8_9EUKA
MEQESMRIRLVILLSVCTQARALLGDSAEVLGDVASGDGSEIYELGLNITAATWYTKLRVTLSGAVSGLDTYREGMKSSFALEIGVSEEQVVLAIDPGHRRLLQGNASAQVSFTTYSSTAEKASAVDAVVEAKLNTTASLEQLLTAAAVTGVTVESEPYTTTNVPSPPPWAPPLPPWWMDVPPPPPSHVSVPLVVAIVLGSLASIGLLASLVLFLGVRTMCEGATLVFFAPEAMLLRPGGRASGDVDATLDDVEMTAITNRSAWAGG